MEGDLLITKAMNNRLFTAAVIRLMLPCFLLLSPVQSMAAADSGQRLSIHITGDVLLDRGVKTLIDMVGLEFVLKGVAPLFSSADYTLINLECPATVVIDPANKRHVFRAEPALLKGLRSASVTHASVANNHTLDQGEAGFIDTIDNLTKTGVIAVGAAKKNARGIKPEIIEGHGIKLAVFAMNMIEVAGYTG